MFDTLLQDGARTTTTTTADITTITDRMKTTVANPFVMAFLGNSILYFNDCPTMLTQLIKEQQTQTQMNDTNLSGVEFSMCLRGGSSFASLWHKGSNMDMVFAGTADMGEATVQEVLSRRSRSRSSSSSNSQNYYDVIVMNDFTQYPAREETSTKSLRFFKKHHAPTIVENYLQRQHKQQQSDRTDDDDDDISNDNNNNIHSNTTKPLVVLIIQTAAYKKQGIRGTEDLGSFDEFSDKLQKGTARYAREMTAALRREHGRQLRRLRKLQEEKKQEKEEEQQERHAEDELDDNDDDEAEDDEDDDDDEEVEATTRATDCPLYTRVAPVGEAYRWLHRHNKNLWNKLYAVDHFHPSPHGTWLQTAVLDQMIFKLSLVNRHQQQQPHSSSSSSSSQEQGPRFVYHVDWWKACRYRASATNDKNKGMSGLDESAYLPVPTPEEALELWNVAKRIVQQHFEEQE